MQLPGHIIQAEDRGRVKCLGIRGQSLNSLGLLQKRTDQSGDVLCDRVLISGLVGEDVGDALVKQFAALENRSLLEEGRGMSRFVNAIDNSRSSIPMPERRS